MEKFYLSNLYRGLKTPVLYTLRTCFRIIQVLVFLFFFFCNSLGIKREFEKFETSIYGEITYQLTCIL